MKVSEIFALQAERDGLQSQLAESECENLALLHNLLSRRRRSHLLKAPPRNVDVVVTVAGVVIRALQLKFCYLLKTLILSMSNGFYTRLTLTHVGVLLQA